MTQVLYRKYRPKTFDEIEGQEHVVQTLKGALLSGRVGHAYLFCGSRGTGKTTMARLLAKSLNCKGSENVASKKKNDGNIPCNTCHACNEVNENRSLDLIEIDAASNRGIDEIRNIKDSAMVAATGGGYKIFLVDEVHMLTTPAFNALLKIVEEPPAHVIFILATTEPHKVPETILSRVQRFDFKKIASEQIIRKLERIAKTEELNVDTPVLAMVASAASGSLRDAESILNKIIAHSTSQDKISEENVADILGIIPAQIHQKILTFITDKNPGGALAEVTRLYEGGVDIENFTKQFVKYLRSQLIHAAGQQTTGPMLATYTNDDRIHSEFLIRAIMLFMKASSETKFSPVPQLPVELAILELVK